MISLCVSGVIEKKGGILIWEMVAFKVGVNAVDSEEDRRSSSSNSQKVVIQFGWTRLFPSLKFKFEIIFFVFDDFD